jgi:hypothetical protein
MGFITCIVINLTIREFVVKTEFIIRIIREFIDSYKKEVKNIPVHYFIVRDNTTIQRY